MPKKTIASPRSMGDNAKITLDQAKQLAAVNIPQAAHLLGISVRTAYTAAASGDLPTVRIVGRLVVPVPGLMRLLGETDQPRDLRLQGHPQGPGTAFVN